MDTILAIETSTACAGVARYEEGRPVEVVEFTSDRLHNALIFAALEKVLGGGRPDLIVAGTGPGSYSGIRVGISAALGLSLACGVPLVGLPSLCAAGEGYALERYAVAGDARRGSWWYAEVSGNRLLLPPVTGSEEEIRERTARWPGQLFTLDAASPPFCQALPVRPRADVLACRAASLTREAVERLAAEETEPLYLRGPFITVSRKPRVFPGGAPAGSGPGKGERDNPQSDRDGPSG